MGAARLPLQVIGMSARSNKSESLMNLSLLPVNPKSGGNRLVSLMVGFSQSE
ncbi:MAG: hypothetical protein V3V52_12500 [Candidatus Adiutricales bacterium]